MYTRGKIYIHNCDCYRVTNSAAVAATLGVVDDIFSLGAAGSFLSAWSRRRVKVSGGGGLS